MLNKTTSARLAYLSSLLLALSYPLGVLQLYHHHRPVYYHFHEESFGEGGFVAPDGSRVLPSGSVASVDRGSWRVPAVFD